jgi:alkylation response protein AidB-like acyl-CoA dehydrogenase
MDMTADGGTTVDEAFRAKVAAFLEANCKPIPPKQTGWGVGSDQLVAQDESDEEERQNFEHARQYRRALADAGLAWISGPVEHGGAGLTSAHERVFAEMAGAYEVPDHVCFIVGLHIVAPTIEWYGTDAAKAAYLAGLYSGDVIGCQLFSEPDAGSDLAGVKTRGVRDGDGWRITGQKVWTSGAHHADIGEVLVRTDPDAPKHRGLTMMLVDMHAPGVTVRPLRQLTGGSEFNEVFLDDVYVGPDDVLGAEGQGWAVANATLGSERQSMGSRDDAENDPTLRLIQLAQHFDLSGDPLVRQRLANLHVMGEIIRYTTKRLGDLAAANSPTLTGSETALIKLMMTNKMRETVDVSGGLLGPRLIADTREWGTYAWAAFALLMPSFRIAGGTDEIMRNVIGERILGLPREPRPDAK